MQVSLLEQTQVEGGEIMRAALYARVSSEEQYLKEKDDITKQLQLLTPPEEKSKVLDQLAEFLRNVSKVWKEADQNQRNRFSRQLFQEIWVKDKQVVAVKPRPELETFFQMSYEDWMKKIESEVAKPAGVATSRKYVTTCSSTAS